MRCVLLTKSGHKINRLHCEYHGSPWRHFEPLKLLNFDFKADPDPAFNFNSDSDPASKHYADPDPQPCFNGSQLHI
jgi:hypothetical protein